MQSFEGYKNPYNETNRIFTEEEIEGFTRQEKNEHSSAVEYQKKTIGIPTNSQAQKVVSSGGMVFVHEYSRADGVHVRSYYRTRPHR